MFGLVDLTGEFGVVGLALRVYRVRLIDNLGIVVGIGVNGPQILDQDLE